MGNVKSTTTNTRHHFAATTVTTENDTVNGRRFSLPVITPLPPIEDVATWTSSSKPISPHPNATTFVNHITDIVSKQVESSLKVSTTREPSITSDGSEDSLPDLNSSSASAVDEEDISASIHTFGPSLSCCDGASPRRQFRNSQIFKANNYISRALLDDTNRTRNKEPTTTTVTESDTHHSHEPSGDSLVDPWLLLGATMLQKQSDNGRSSNTSFLSYSSTKRSSSVATSINTNESYWCPSTSSSFVPNSPLLTEPQSSSQASDQPNTGTSMKEPLEAESSSSSTKECAICAEILPASSFEKVTTHCSHEQNVCDGCIGRHISSELANKGNFRIRCPSEVECRNILEDTDVKKFASRGDHDRYQKLSVRAAISQIPDFHYCSNPKCDSGQIHYEGVHAPIMNCTACGQKSCVIHDLPIYPGTGGCAKCEKIAASVTSRISGFFSNLALPSSSSSSPPPPPSSIEPGCSTLSTPIPTSVSTSSLSRYSLFGKRDLAGLTLEQYAEKQRQKSDAKKEARRQKKISKEEKKSEKFVSIKAKLCPQCSSRIIKKGGCDHMTCQAPGCGHEFCWLCMADYRTVLEQGNQEHQPFCKYHK